MGAWEFVVDVFRPVAVGLLLVALGWAASERGRIHHDLVRLRRVSGIESASRSDRFSALDRSLRRRPDRTSDEGT